MAEDQIRFNDGAAYERMMGVWSRLAGEIFLDWLAPRPGLRWVDVGCGNGAFTEVLADRSAPAALHGIDPSEGQLAFARNRPAARIAKFHQGDAMALPFPDDHFDAAVMALVIFFVPEPAKGVAEMARVVGPGGTLAAYAWDMYGGGFPLEPIAVEMRAMGIAPMVPPSVDASRIEAMRELWTAAGVEAIETRTITVQRTYANFDEFWSVAMKGSSLGAKIAALPAGDSEQLEARVRARLTMDAAGPFTRTARANAIKGRLPK